MAKVIVRQVLGKTRVELDTGDGPSVDIPADLNGYQTAHELVPFMQALCDACDAAHEAWCDAQAARVPVGMQAILDAVPEPAPSGVQVAESDPFRGPVEPAKEPA